MDYLRIRLAASLLRSSGFIVTAGAGLLVVAEYLFRTQFAAASAAVPYIFYWLLIAGTFTALILLPWQRYRQESDRLLVAAFLTGLLIAAPVAIYKVIAYHELWAVFNLLAEPIRASLFGLLLSWLLIQVSPSMPPHEALPSP